KCTQCGHIFKVKKRAASQPQKRTLPGIPKIGDDVTPLPPPMPPAPPIPSAPVRDPSGPILAAGDARVWLLRSAATGEVRRFRELTTLQQWIVEKRVAREDEISRTGDFWKRLGAIPELTPFFRV